MSNTAFVYGLLPPVDGADRVAQQMRAAHAYRNQLVELLRTARAERREVERAAEPERVRVLREAVASALESVEAIAREVRLERQRKRKRAESGELRARLMLAKNLVRERRKDLREAERVERANRVGLFDAVNQEFAAARRAARPGLKSRGEDEGLRAGTYQLVEDAAGRSDADLPLWDNEQPQDPHFLRWTGDGAVSEQIPGGATWGDIASGEHTQVRISEQPAGTRDNRIPGSKRSATRKRVMLWLRVGSRDKGRTPVWACWPMVMHRPLPDGAQIQRVTVRLRHVGPRAEWSARFDLRVPDAAARAGKAIALDVGWRQRGDVLRTAYACDQDGATHEVAMPARIVGGLGIADGIRSTRDKNMGAVRSALLRWIGERGGIANLPWLAEHAGTIGQWRSPRRFAALAIKWRAARFDGDVEAFDLLEAWRRQDRHLWLFEASQRKGAERARTDWFRRIAAELAERYAVLVLEKFNLRAVARRQPVEATERPNETSAHNRVLAATGEFRDVLRWAFRKIGGHVVQVPAEHTTTTCHACGSVQDFDKAAMLRHRCGSCGVEWDQDENAARNLIERWRTEPNGGGARSVEQPTESRRERVRRMAEERKRRRDRSQVGPDAPMASEAV